MVRIVGVNDTQRGSVVLDDYLPITFNATREIRPSPFLWRFYPDDQNLLELKIDRDSGEIYKATLVATSQSIVAVEESPCSDVPFVPGLPVADVAAFGVRPRDEPRAFHLVRAGRALGIVLDGAAQPTACIGIDRVRFLVTHESLVGICFDSITDAEWNCWHARVARIRAYGKG